MNGVGGKQGDGSGHAWDGEPSPAQSGPLVSIITVSLNSEKHIEETIESVAGQSYKNIEYIIIDGGSSDGTLDIIRKHQDSISRWISEPDNGIYDAMNKGIDLSHGEIIGIINSDDWYMPNAVEEIVKASTGTGKTGVLFGNMLVFNEKGKYIGEVTGSLEGLTRDMTLNHPTVFMGRESLGDERFRTDMQIASDYELMLRLRGSGAAFHYIDRQIACYRKGGKSFDHRRRFLELYGVRRDYGLISEREYRVRVMLLPLKVKDVRCEEYLTGAVSSGRPGRVLLPVYRRLKRLFMRLPRLT